MKNLTCKSSESHSMQKEIYNQDYLPYCQLVITYMELCKFINLSKQASKIANMREMVRKFMTIILTRGTVANNNQQNRFRIQEKKKFSGNLGI